MKPEMVFQLVVALACVSISCAAENMAENVFLKASKGIYVIIAINKTGETTAQGSGVLINKNIIVTNCHVVNDADSIIAVHGSNKYRVQLEHRDLDRDLCTLKGSRLPKTTPAKFRPSGTLRKGEAVFSVGAPLGLDLSIGNGIVSGLRSARGGKIIQTTAPISPGSSGGGLFDSDGRLVGITTYSASNGQNVNFALPSEWVNLIEIREEMEKELRATRKDFDRRIASLWGRGDERSRMEIIKMANRYLTKDPDYIPAIYYLGTSLFMEDPTGNETVNILRRLVEIPVNSIVDFHHVGVGAMFLSESYLKLGKSDEARPIAGLAASYIPNKALMGRYWSMLTEPQHYKEAVSVFRVAVTVNPDSAEAWAYLAGSQRNSGDYRSAIQSFERSIEISPEYEWAWVGYILTLKELGDNKKLEKAVKYLYENNKAVLDKIMKSLYNNDV